MQVIQQIPGEIAIVRGKTGLTAFEELRAIYLPLDAIALRNTVRSKPIQVSGELTKVTYTSGEHSAFRGAVEMTYRRYSIQVLSNMDVPGGGWVSVDAFISYLKTTLNIQVVNADFDLVKSVRRADGSVGIYPSKDSWLFSPDGSFDSSSMQKIEDLLTNLTTPDFDHTPKLHLAIGNDTLNGFEEVEPFVLGDEIAVDTLNGFDVVGGN
jgi:hypothetical protein